MFQGLEEAIQHSGHALQNTYKPEMVGFFDVTLTPGT